MIDYLVTVLNVCLCVFWYLWITFSKNLIFIFCMCIHVRVYVFGAPLEFVGTCVYINVWRPQVLFSLSPTLYIKIVSPLISELTNILVRLLLRASCLHFPSTGITGEPHTWVLRTQTLVSHCRRQALYPLSRLHSLPLSFLYAQS